MPYELAPWEQDIEETPVATPKKRRGRGPDIEAAATAAIPGVTVSSGYRTPADNRRVGGVKNSYHMTDDARDFVPPSGMSMAGLHSKLKATLPGYDVINEGDHIHTEPGPGGGGRLDVATAQPQYPMAPWEDVAPVATAAVSKETPLAPWENPEVPVGRRDERGSLQTDTLEEFKGIGRDDRAVLSEQEVQNADYIENVFANGLANKQPFETVYADFEKKFPDWAKAKGRKEKLRWFYEQNGGKINWAIDPSAPEYNQNTGEDIVVEGKRRTPFMQGQAEKDDYLAARAELAQRTGFGGALDRLVARGDRAFDKAVYGPIADALGVDLGYPDKTEEEYSEDERLARAELEARLANSPRGDSIPDQIVGFGADLVGGVGPDYLLPGAVGKTAFGRTMSAPIVGMGVDAGLQGIENAEGLQDGFDYNRNLMAGATQGVFQAGGEAIAHKIGKRYSDTGTEYTTFDNPRVIETTSGTPSKPSAKRGTGKAEEHKAAIGSEVARVTNGWADSPEFVVHSSAKAFEKAEPELARRVKQDGAGGARAFVDDDGAVHILGHNIKDVGTVESTIFHEALGHYGLAKEYGDELGNRLNELYAKNYKIANETKEKAFTTKYGDIYVSPENAAAWKAAREAGDRGEMARILDADDNMRALVVEEVLADRSEKGVLSKNIADNISITIRDFGRRMGLDLRFSNREVKAFLADAHNAVINKDKLGQTTPSGLRYMYIGKKGATNLENSYRKGEIDISEELGIPPDPKILADFEANMPPESIWKAQELIDAGEDPYPGGRVHKETGWFLAPDGRYRAEVTDENAFLHNSFRSLGPDEVVPLDKFFRHPTLYEYYPELRNVELSRKPYDNPSIMGSAGTNKAGKRYINLAPRADDPLGTILHEVQHVIQDIEGFSTGGNPAQALHRLSPKHLEEVEGKVKKYWKKLIDRYDLEARVAEAASADPDLKVYGDLSKKTREFYNARTPFSDPRYTAVREEKDALEKVLRQKYLGTSSILEASRADPKSYSQFNKLIWEASLGNLDNWRATSQRQAASYREAFESLEKAETKRERVNILGRMQELRIEAYNHLFGEVEARDTTNRAKLDLDQRFEKKPYTSEDWVDPSAYVFDRGMAGYGDTHSVKYQLDDGMAGVTDISQARDKKAKRDHEKFQRENGVFFKTDWEKTPSLEELEKIIAEQEALDAADTSKAKQALKEMEEARRKIQGYPTPANNRYQLDDGMHVDEDTDIKRVLKDGAYSNNTVLRQLVESYWMVKSLSDRVPELRNEGINLEKIRSLSSDVISSSNVWRSDDQGVASRALVRELEDLGTKYREFNKIPDADKNEAKSYLVQNGVYSGKDAANLKEPLEEAALNGLTESWLRQFRSGKNPRSATAANNRYQLESEVMPKKVMAKFMTAMKGAKYLNEEYTARVKADRADKIKKLKAIRATSKGESGINKQLAALKGETAKTYVQPFREKFTQKEINSLFSGVQKYPGFTMFESLRAGVALKKLMDGELPNKGELELLSQVLPKDFLKYAMDLRTRGHKLKDALHEGVSLPRALMASTDMSGPFRQGLFFVGRKNFWKALPKQFAHWWDEDFHNAQREEIREHPEYDYSQQVGLDLSEIGKANAEEIFQSDIARKVPGVKASERAYTGFLNQLRFDMWKQLVRDGMNAGIDFRSDLEAAKSLASYINAATGRSTNLHGTGRHLSRHGEVYSAMLFAPKLAASRVNLLNPFYYGSLHPFVRKQAIRDLSAMSGFITGILALASYAGADVETDPRSSDFLKIRAGTQRYDVTGGFAPYITLVSRLINGGRKTLKGEETQYGKGLGGTRLEEVANFFRKKAAPVPAYFMDALAGKNVVGEKFHPVKDAAESFIPLFVQDLYEGYQREGWFGSLKATPSFFGFGSGNYDQVPYKYDQYGRDVEAIHEKDPAIEELDRLNTAENAEGDPIVKGILVDHVDVGSLPEGPVRDRGDQDDVDLLSKVAGEYMMEDWREFMQSQDYQEMTDEERIKEFRLIKRNARADAKAELWPEKDEE